MNGFLPPLTMITIRHSHIWATWLQASLQTSGNSKSGGFGPFSMYLTKYTWNVMAVPLRAASRKLFCNFCSHSVKQRFVIHEKLRIDLPDIAEQMVTARIEHLVSPNKFCSNEDMRRDFRWGKEHATDNVHHTLSVCHERSHSLFFISPACFLSSFRISIDSLFEHGLCKLQKNCAKNYEKHVLTHLPGPGGWAFLREHSHLRFPQPKCEGSKIIIRILLQMVRKCIFEAPEGRDWFWAPRPGMQPGSAKSRS